MKGAIRIGISGWTYPPWRGGAFYPEEWPQKRELEFASRQVRTIEINGSFYSLQTPKSYRAWHAATPEDFVFSVKGPRFITHIKRLRDIDAPLANFFGSGVLLLREKLGPIILQLPPGSRFDRHRLAEFFARLPRDTKAAAALARKHDHRIDGRAWTKTDAKRPLHHCLEVRHASFANADFIELLRDNKIGLVVADTAGKWPFMEDVTADFVYVRLHGDKELYVSGYTPAALKKWENKIRAWQAGRTPRGSVLVAPKAASAARRRDVFVYFDNDVKVRAPFDAMTLAHRLGFGPAPGRPPKTGAITETARTRWPGFGKSGQAGRRIRKQ